MRHLIKGKSLGVNPSHRRAMLRSLVTSLLVSEKIETTVVRAKQMRTYLDKMITLAKCGDLPARRKAMTFVRGKKAIIALFGDLSLRYQSRSGGYSRILPIGCRLGDAAPMAVMVLVDGPKDPFGKLAQEGKLDPKKTTPDKKLEADKKLETSKNLGAEQAKTATPLTTKTPSLAPSTKTIKVVGKPKEDASKDKALKDKALKDKALKDKALKDKAAKKAEAAQQKTDRVKNKVALADKIRAFKAKITR